MKHIILVSFIFISMSIFSEESHWNKHIKLIDQDISVIQKTRKKDTGIYIRLFELYGEKLALLIEKENEILIEYLESGKNKKLKRVRKVKRKTFMKLDHLSNLLERSIKDSQIRAKIFYYRSLYNYMLKRYKSFYLNIKKAEKVTRSKKLKGTIWVKLADYHYNERQFKKAAFYYRKIIRNKSDLWRTKHLYNYGWCLIKLGREKESLKYFVKSFKLERTSKKYFKLGEQSINAIMFAYTLNHKVNRGLRFLKKYKIGNFERVLLYLNYTFEHGNKLKTVNVLSALKTYVRNSDDFTRYVEKSIIVLRNMKKYSLINRLIKKSFRNKLKLSKRYGSELVSSLKGYTGYLQELVKSKAYLKKKNQLVYLKYITTNFNYLSKIDPKNKVEYVYYQGETYFSLKRFEEALIFYKKGIILSRKNSNNFKKRFFDAYFKSIEEMTKKVPPIRKNNYLSWGYDNYLREYPRGKKSKKIYLKFFNLLYAKNKSKSAPLKLIARYFKYFPKSANDQTKMYRRLVNKYAKRENIPRLNELLNASLKGQVKIPIKDKRKLVQIIHQIYFKRYNSFVKKGQYDQALKGLRGFYQNVKLNYNLRKKSMVLILDILEKKNAFIDVSTSLTSYINFLRPKEYKAENERLQYYANSLCQNGFFDQCYLQLKKLYSIYKGQLDKALVGQLFQISVTRNNFDTVSMLYRSKSVRADRTLKDYLLQTVMLVNDKSFGDIYLRFSRFPEISKDLNLIARDRFISGLNFEENVNIFSYFCKTNKIPACYDFKRVKSQIAKTQFYNLENIPKFKNGKVGFEQFSSELNQIMGHIQGQTRKLENDLKQMEDNLKPHIISKGIRFYQNIIDVFSSYSPQSEDIELKKAIVNEVHKLTVIMNTKLAEYEKLKRSILSKLNDRLGFGRQIRNSKSEFIGPKTIRKPLWLGLDY